MVVEREQIEKILKTLPIGYYTGTDKVKAELDDNARCSFINTLNLQISVSTQQLNEAFASVPEEEENNDTTEEVIRTMLYHEVAHSLLTPVSSAYQGNCDHDVLNIFEDERIETLCKNEFLNTDFKNLIHLLNPIVKKYDYSEQNQFGSTVPESSMKAMFYNFIRLREYEVTSRSVVNEQIKELLPKIDEIIYKYEDVVNNSDCGEYTRAIGSLYNTFSKIIRDGVDEPDDEENEKGDEDNSSLPDDENDDNNSSNDNTSNSGDSSDDEENDDEENDDEENFQNSQGSSDDTNDDNNKEENGKDDENGMTGNNDEENGENGESISDTEENEENNENETKENGNESTEDTHGNGQQTHRLKEIATELERRTTDQAFSQNLVKVINQSLKKITNNTSVVNRYSGRLDPRSVTREDYRWWTGQGQQKKGQGFSPVQVNIWIDDSSSFDRNGQAECMRQVITSICRLPKDPNLTFKFIIGYQQNNYRMKKRVFSTTDTISYNYSNGTCFDYDLIEKLYRENQNPKAVTCNIIIIDGFAFECGKASEYGAYQRAQAWSLFNHNNCAIISDISNYGDIKKACPMASKIYLGSGNDTYLNYYQRAYGIKLPSDDDNITTSNKTYVDNLKDEILNQLSMLLRRV